MGFWCSDFEGISLIFLPFKRDPFPFGWTGGPRDSRSYIRCCYMIGLPARDWHDSLRVEGALKKKAVALGMFKKQNKLLNIFLPRETEGIV